MHKPDLDLELWSVIMAQDSADLPPQLDGAKVPANQTLSLTCPIEAEEEVERWDGLS